MDTKEILKISDQDLEQFETTIRLNPQLLITKDNNQRTLLHWTALQGREHLVEHLLTFPETNSVVDEPDDTAATPLILATLKGNINIVKWLLDKGADVNHKNQQGHSPLQYACSKGYKDIVEYLLSHGANINIQDNRGDTSIHRLVSLGRTEILSMLLGHCVEPDLGLQNSEGNTALHIACEDDESTCALLLIEHKASVEVENKKKQMPLDLCKPGLRRAISDKVNV